MFANVLSGGAASAIRSTQLLGIPATYTTLELRGVRAVLSLIFGDEAWERLRLGAIYSTDLLFRRV